MTFARKNFLGYRQVLILSRAPQTQRLDLQCMSVSARTKFGPHRVFQHLDRYVTGPRL